MHIYIHIPFCTSKCPYCAFGSRMDAFKLAKNYFDALNYEISNFIKKNKNFKISTLFIGGGTPSVVSAQYYEKIFEKLSPNFAQNAEITTEANPNSAKPKWIEQMRKFGVNRISFGAQSFNDEKLKFLGRTHGKNEIFEAVDNAKNAGISNINLDLIYASKFDDKQNLEFELTQFARAGVSHLSAYALTLEPGTPFFGRAEFARDDENLAKFFFKKASELGFTQYEISNFAKNGRRCAHNVAYWSGEDYAGFGAHAVGTSGFVRYSGAGSIEEYIQNPLAKSVENLSLQDKILEKIFLGFRSFLGVRGEILRERELKNAQILSAEGKLDFKNGVFYNPNFLLADEIALFVSEH
ncbi:MULTISPECIES: radical SAM family heme chaperone HemW [unclassified Campylobacter]|uniref:radical SAM family heme chaperone HemW n=1 Tax=unclassified Campylobacter TaxID=2593542 RepID=UPI0022E9E488|nr:MULTISPECIES: radical SAM family heme chaperone HemW [unclassified Campylobacter]MDA3061794.1 radical SAM family heme chaperone HemW [Campylobacter sp. JMF_14 EL1]MDA3073100.1 radical SAM family heme chaperone HemW [Campylobacter sp. JMF_10 EL2]